MTKFEVLLLAALVGAIAFQVWLTVRVWRSNLFDRSQKLMQSKLIWLVPIIGAMLVFSVLQEEDPTESKRDTSGQLRS